MNVREPASRAWLSLIVGTVVVVCGFFREVLLGQGVFYSGDIARIYLPQRTELSRALASGSLPWWTARLGAGYPLLAEGEVGALYSPNWLLYGMLPAEIALNASIILHYLLAGAGFYVYARSLRASRKAAYFGVLVFSLGGFYVSHLSHVSIATAAAWLPWMFALTHQVLAPQNDRQGVRLWAILGLGIVVGLQFLGGHAQISLLSLIASGAYAVFLAWPDGASRTNLQRWGGWLGALLMGALLASPQLLATLELASLSQRAGGLDSAFFTSYSLHPALLATFVSPFLLGNPYPHGSVELMGYVGVLPLVLATRALWRSPSKAKWFFAGLALMGLLLALGRWNPLYERLRSVPFLNLFRVPARYLLWTSFALAALSVLGFDTICRLQTKTMSGITWACLGLCVLVSIAVLAKTCSAADVEHLVASWRWFPLLLAIAALGLMVAARSSRGSVWTVVAYGVLLADLYAYGAVLDGTYSSTMPRDQVVREPRSLSFFAQDHGLYRLYTKEEILPALSVMRESFYPNMALASGLPSANIYQPLVPEYYGAYLSDLTAQRLNRLNVKYYLIPQLLPVDEARELYDVQNPFASLPVNAWLDLPPTDVAALEVESYLSHSVNLKDGELAAELLLRDASGREVAFPLRAGLETAEWAYERDDVLASIRHRMPQIATTFPARSGSPPHEHPGHTYQARQKLDAPMRIVAVQLRLVLHEAFMRVERVRLLGPAGQEQLLAHLIGLGDHSIVYRSEDVVIYRNEDVLPRAYTLPESAVALKEGQVVLPEILAANDTGPVEVLGYDDTRVELRAKVDVVSYLVLADLAYPGWRATVDGVEAPILCADDIFRAVALPPGEHQVVFAYSPTFQFAPWPVPLAHSLHTEICPPGTFGL